LKPVKIIPFILEKRKAFGKRRNYAWQRISKRQKIFQTKRIEYQ
jgi:hypothetical protein